MLADLDRLQDGPLSTFTSLLSATSVRSWVSKFCSTFKALTDDKDVAVYYDPEVVKYDAQFMASVVNLVHWDDSDCFKQLQGKAEAHGLSCFPVTTLEAKVSQGDGVIDVSTMGSLVTALGTDIAPIVSLLSTSRSAAADVQKSTAEAVWQAPNCISEVAWKSDSKDAKVRKVVQIIKRHCDWGPMVRIIHYNFRCTSDSWRFLFVSGHTLAADLIVKYTDMMELEKNRRR